MTCDLQRLRWALALALTLGAVSPICGQRTVVIGFEQDQGFPAAGGEFTDGAVPETVVTRWSNDSAAPNMWVADDGPLGVRSQDAPAPVNGKQIAGFGDGGHGVTVGTIHLNTSGAPANYALVSFHWAYRGNGNSRPGGDAYLEVECIDLQDRSLGREKFTGGLNDDWTPKFESAKVTLAAGKALSRIIFRGVPPNPAIGSGTFFLDDITLLEVPPVSKLSLVKAGRSACTIVVPDDAPMWTKTAAAWLQEYVEKISGAQLPIATEGNAPTGTLISVGHTALAREAGVDTTGLKWDDCRLVVADDVLYLLGRDHVGTNTHDWVGARGTCRAVIKFLEDFCRVRWFLPGPQGERVPKATDIGVPHDLNETGRTAFAYSDGRSVYDEDILNEPGKTLAAQANNYRKAVKVSPGGHTYYHAVPTGKYFDDHPDYFALLNGKRTGPGNHLCSSNPDVKRILTEYMEMRFDQGLDWVSIGQEDGYLRCQCDQCDALDNYRDLPDGMRWEVFQNSSLIEAPPERLFQLHKGVADALAASRPDKMVMLMCYAPTAWPSKKIDSYGDKIIGELMNLNPEYIAAWRGKVAGLAGFTYWFNTQCPMGLNLHMTAEEAATRIRYLHENGFVAISLNPEATWGLEGPVFYMMGRLLGDPTQDYNAIISEYCDGVYGKASGSMLEFFELAQQRLSQVVPISDDDIAADARNTQMPRWLNTSAMFLAMYPPDVLARLESLMQRAEATADTPRNKGWVRLSRDQFDFVRLLTEMLIAYRAWQTKETPENWQELKAGVDAFEAWRLKIVTYPKSYTDVWWPGHATFCKWLCGNLEDTTVAFYVPWEKRKKIVMEKGIRGMPMGYGQSYYYSFIKEPLTLDFE